MKSKRSISSTSSDSGGVEERMHGSHEEDDNSNSPKRSRNLDGENDSDNSDVSMDGHSRPSKRNKIQKERTRVKPINDSDTSSEDDNDTMEDNNYESNDEYSAECSDSGDYTSYYESSTSYEPPDPYHSHLRAELENKKREKKKVKKAVHDSDDEDEHFSPDVQEVSIHKIALQKFKKNQTRKEDLEDIIKKIIKSYNSPDQTTKNSAKSKRERKRKQDKENGPHYMEENVIIYPDMNEEDTENFDGDEFSVKVYVQEVPKELRLLRSYGINCSSKAVHSIVFLYRKDEIFALTTGQAWNVVHKFSDVDFPSRISARILSEKGQISTNNKVLIGDQSHNKKAMKSSQEFNPRQLLEVCTCFIAEIRENASILKYSCFSKIRSGKGGTAKLQVNLTSVRFLKRLKASDFLCILSHMSIIHRGEKTFKYPAGDINEEEKDTDVHQKYLAKNSREESKHLDILLANEFRKAINREASSLLQYDLCHKHINDFIFATKYYLFHKHEKIKTFRRCPSLLEVIKAIWRNKTAEGWLLKEGNRATAAKPDAFLNALSRITLSFVKHHDKSETKPEKIINYLEGSTIDRDGRANWRVMSIWCTLRNEYLLVAHSQWLELLKGFLIDEYDDVNLDMTASENYTEKFRNKKGYFVFETTAEDECIDKPFDMLRINDENEILIYFIAESLSIADFSKIGSQVSKTVTTIKNVNVRITEKKKETLTAKALKNYYEANKRLLKRHFPKYTIFIDALNSAKIVIAIKNSSGVNDDDNNSKSLYDEAILTTRMTEDKLLTILEDVNRNDVKDACESLNIRSNSRTERHQLFISEIFSILKELDYLDENNNITSKLLIANERNFKLQKGNSVNELVYENIVQKYQSHFNTLRPKLELVNVRKNLNQNDWKLFSICEISN